MNKLLSNKPEHRVQLSEDLSWRVDSALLVGCTDYRLPNAYQSCRSTRNVYGLRYEEIPEWSWLKAG